MERAMAYEQEKVASVSPEGTEENPLASSVAGSSTSGFSEHFLSRGILQKSILDAIPVPIFCKDLAGRFFLVNQAFVQAIGFSEEELLGKSVFDIAPRDLAETYHAMDTPLLHRAMNQVYESRIRDRNGNDHEVIFHKSSFASEDGMVLGIVGAILDVTALKRVEAQLKVANEDLEARVAERTAALTDANQRLALELVRHEETERKLLLFHKLVNQTSEAVFVVDPRTAAILEVNEAACSYTKYSRENLLAMTVMDIAFARNDADNWRIHMQELIAMKHLLIEDVLRCKDGSKVPVEVSVKYLEHGDEAFVFAIVRDISRRKEMEGHIRMTNEILKLSSANISLEDYLSGLGQLIKLWCECSDAVVRLNHEPESCAEPFVCTRHIGSAQVVLEKMGHSDCACARVLGGIGHLGSPEVLTPAGSFLCQDTAAFIENLSPGEKQSLHAACLMRTFRSIAMIPISHEKKILGIIVFGDDRVNMISPKTVNVLESLAPTVAEVIRRHHFEVQLRQSREQLRMLAVHIEEAREEERTRIAREVHDQLGQILTALKIDLSWLQSSYPDDPQHVDKTRDMLALVNRTIFTVKKIVTDLRPSVLDHLGIVEAIEWQASEVQKLTGIRCVVDSVPSKIILEKNMMTHIFRIFQEIMTNVVRHAEAANVMVSIISGGDGFSLSVTDDGSGIPEKKDSAPTSLGILGMKERAHSIGGTLEFSRVEPSGTLVSLRIPKGGSRDGGDENA